MPNIRFVTESGSRYEVFTLGHMPALVRHDPDGSSTTVAINLTVADVHLGAPGYFVGDHAVLGPIAGKDYRISTSRIREVVG